MKKVLLVGNPGDAVISVARQMGTGPFRAPHYMVSMVGLLGGQGRTGEVSLAHEGTLFLDEIFNFRRNTVEELVRVLALGYSEYTYKGEPLRFPASPNLVVASFPKCDGYLRGVSPCRTGACVCSASDKRIYTHALTQTIGRFKPDEVIELNPTKVEPWEISIAQRWELIQLQNRFEVLNQAKRAASADLGAFVSGLVDKALLNPDVEARMEAVRSLPSEAKDTVERIFLLDRIDQLENSTPTE